MARSRHILVIRLSAMGDVAMLVPLFRSIFNTYPDLNLTLVSRPHLKPVFKEFTRLDFFGVDLNKRHKGLTGLYQLYKDLRLMRPTAVADMHSVLRTHVVDFFFQRSGMQVIKIDKGRKEKKALTRAKDKNFTQLRTTVERYADVFRKLDCPIELPAQNPRTRLSIPDNLLTQLPSHENSWVGIAPFASFEGKTYPLELMKEVVETLSKKNTVLLFAAPGAEANEMNLWAKGHDWVHSMTNLGSFESELTVISQLELMISMDSANGHLAANFGVPVLTIWGLTHPLTGFAPYGQQAANNITLDPDNYPLVPTSVYGNKIPKGYAQAMNSISPDSIVKRAEGILASV